MITKLQSISRTRILMSQYIDHGKTFPGPHRHLRLAIKIFATIAIALAWSQPPKEQLPNKKDAWTRSLCISVSFFLADYILEFVDV